jgi:hypothetical protein
MTVERGQATATCPHCGTTYRIAVVEARARLVPVETPAKQPAPLKSLKPQASKPPAEVSTGGKPDAGGRGNRAFYLAVAGIAVAVVAMVIVGLVAYSAGKRADRPAERDAGEGQPAAAPDLGDCDIDAWAALAGGDVVDFLDATEMAMSTRRDSVAPLARDMQQAYRDFERKTYPGCAERARRLILDGMEYAVEMINEWGAGEDTKSNVRRDYAAENLYDASDALRELGATSGFIDKRLMLPALLWNNDPRGEIDAERTEIAVMIYATFTSPAHEASPTPSPSPAPRPASRENPAAGDVGLFVPGLAEDLALYDVIHTEYVANDDGGTDLFVVIREGDIDGQSWDEVVAMGELVVLDIVEVWAQYGAGADSLGVALLDADADQALGIVFVLASYVDEYIATGDLEEFKDSWYVTHAAE